MTTFSLFPVSYKEQLNAEFHLAALDLLGHLKKTEPSLCHVIINTCTCPNIKHLW